MPDDTKVVDTAQDSSPVNSQESTVSEDANTQAQEVSEENRETEETSEESEGDVPFHKHPRFLELIQENREAKAKLAELEEQRKLEALPSEDRAVYESIKKYGLVRQEDLTRAKQDVQRLKDDIEMRELVSDNPDVKRWEGAIRELGYSPQNITKSYGEIYQEYFSSSSGSSAPKRTVKTGLKTISSGEKSSGAKWTREKLANLSPEEYSKNRDEILKFAAEGKIL